MGGLRNPRRALERLPRSAAAGRGIRRLLEQALHLWPELLDPAVAILRGEEPAEFNNTVVESVRSAVLTALGAPEHVRKRRRTAPANTPIQAAVLQAWGLATDDPDAEVLSEWLDNGAPLGIEQAVPTTGVFPPVSASSQLPASQLDRRTLEGWENYPSAQQESQVLRELLADYAERGFCTLATTPEEAARLLGGTPVLNKLGVIVKDKVDSRGRPVRKARVIWDLRESRVNQACCQGERILLPRLLDVVLSLLNVYRKGGKPYLAGMDIRDAFMNIPAGADRKYTVAAVPGAIVVFNTLVFGSASSPTLWGRMAAWLGRSTAAVTNTDPQCYVDDPIFVLFGPGLGAAAKDLAVALLWIAVAGFPTKLGKANGGKVIDWVGARIECHDDEQTVVVTLPAQKISQLAEQVEKMLNRSVVGARELRSLAGSLSFVAGLVPHLRPFLSTFWAVLTKFELTSEGKPFGKARKLIHTSRIAPGLRWVRALLQAGTLRKTFLANPPHTDFEIVTDASPWGIGGILRRKGEACELFFSCLPDTVLHKFGAERGVSKFNTLWQGLALLVAFRLWLPSLPYGAVYRAKSDNLGFLRALARGSAKSPALNVLAREFALDERSYQVRGLSRIPGISNVQADALSRIFSPEPKHFPPELEHVPARAVDFATDFWKV